MKVSNSKARLASVAVAALGLAGFSLPSQAVIISATSNNPYSFSWSHTVTGSDSLQHTLTGTGRMVVGGFNSASLTIDIILNNTSLLGGQGGERLTGFGFGINPNATSVTFGDAADAGMINARLGQTFPSMRGIEVCAISGPTCAGGSNGGIFARNSDTFRITLGGTWGDSVDINPIGLKYQTGYGSFEFSPGSSVPAPGPLALFGFGMAALAFRRRVEAS